MRRQRHQETAPPGAPIWMVSFSDLITQVLCFFILLYSFSSVDANKFQQSVISLRDAFGVLKGGQVVAGDSPLSPSITPMPAEEPVVEAQGTLSDQAQLAALMGRLEAAMARRGMKDGMQLILEERGLVLRFPDSALFDLGRAQLRPEAMPYLDEVAHVMVAAANQVRVEGHTDDLPINTPIFPSNWELSGARAASVVRYFLEHHSLDPGRLSLAGYGEHRPVAPNEGPAGRQRNRRVDIVVLPLGQMTSEPE